MLNIDVGGQKHRRDMAGRWKTVDISTTSDYIHNLNEEEPLPFKDNSVDNIYTSDTLEHVEPVQITFVLQEFYRILKPGGKCRIVVPDSAYAIKQYINNPKELSHKKYCAKPLFMPATPMGYLTAWFHTNKRGLGTGHKLGFDEELMRAFIARTEFKDVISMEYNKCSKIFKGKDYERYAGWSLYIEVTK